MIANAVRRSAVRTRYPFRLNVIKSLSSAVDPCPAPSSVQTTLGDLVSRSKDVVSLNAYESVQEAVEKMGNKLAASIFVEKEGFVVGIVKESNVIDLIVNGKDLATTDVESVMETNIQFASLSSPVREALEILNQTKLDYVPIIDSEEHEGSVRTGQVKAMLSAKVIIGQHCNDEEVEKSLSVSVKSIFKFKEEAELAKGVKGQMVLNTLLEDNISVFETMCQMRKHKKGSVAVMDTCRDVPVLTGIVTEQDIVRRALCKKIDLHKSSVADIMTSDDLETVTTKDTLLTCVRKMNEGNLRHLPVVSAKGTHLLAMVSSKDIISFLVDQLPSSSST